MLIRPIVRRRFVALSASAALLLSAGCQRPTAPPVSASLLGLTAEASHRKSEIVDYRELVSIAGMLPMIEPGTFYHYPRRSWWQVLLNKPRLHSPSYAVGMTPDFNQETFYLVGELETQATQHDIQRIKNLLEEVQRLTGQAIQLSLELAAQKRETCEAVQELEASPITALVSNDENGEGEGTLTDLAGELAETIQPKPDPDAQPTPPATQDPASSSASTPAKSRLQQLTDNLAEVEAKLNCAEEKYAKELNKYPGVLVARWAVGQSAGGSARAGDIIDARSDETTRQTGFVILSGLRISVLYFGSDFRTFVQATEARDQAGLERLGITSYLMQAQHVAYTSGREFEQYRSLSIEFSPNQARSWASLIENIDKIRIGTYLARLENLENSASFSGMNWETQPRPLLKYVPMTDADRARVQAHPQYEELNRDGDTRGLKWRRIDHTGVFDQFTLPTATTDEPEPGPQTIYAVMVSAKQLYRQWRKAKYDYQQPISVGDNWYIMIDPQARAPHTGTPTAGPSPHQPPTPLRTR